jgi:hypothetical protein
MKTWTLYWSPTGQDIGIVQAKTMRAAIRKASMPYRKYLGEIYAVLSDREYVAGKFGVGVEDLTEDMINMALR